MPPAPAFAAALPVRFRRPAAHASAAPSAPRMTSTTPRRGPGRARKPRPKPPADPARRPPSLPSALARKYRPTPLHPDELELVGGWEAGARRDGAGGAARGIKGVGVGVAERECRGREAGGRFPEAWVQVVRQAGDATVAAMQQGHDRLLVDVGKVELLARRRRRRTSEGEGDGGSGAGEAGEDGVGSLSSAHLYGGSEGLTSHFALTLDVCNAIVGRLCAGEGEIGGSRMREDAKIIMFFNNEEEAAMARRIAHPAYATRVEFQVLNQSGPERGPTDVCIVVAPSNRRGDPSRIEAVERIHYSNWNDSNLVIMVNPALIALTGFMSLEGCVRPPCFLTDYIHCYYLDPQVFSTKYATGAVLRCYPRKWESYMQRVGGPSSCGFRLVAESDERPRKEKLLCEFAWRADGYRAEALRPPAAQV